MMPLHPNFRRLLLAKIPQLKREDLNNYDSLLALRYQAVHQRSLETRRRKDLDALIEETTRAANTILSRFRAQFDKLHRLWLARRRLALRQGDILQIPTTWPNFLGLIVAALDHSWTQFTVFWSPLRLRIKELSVARVFAIIILIGLILYGITSLPTDNDRRKPEKPQQQDAGQIRQ